MIFSKSRDMEPQVVMVLGKVKVHGDLVPKTQRQEKALTKIRISPQYSVPKQSRSKTPLKTSPMGDAIRQFNLGERQKAKQDARRVGDFSMDNPIW